MKMLFAKKSIITAFAFVLASFCCVSLSFATSGFGGGESSGSFSGGGFSTGTTSTAVSYDALSKLCLALNDRLASGDLGSNLKSVSCNIEFYDGSGNYDRYAIVYHYQGTNYWYCNASGGLVYCYTNSDSTLNDILTALVGSNNGTGGIRKYVDEIATVSWRIDSALSDLSDALTSVISNGKVLVDNSDVVSAIQSIPAFDDSDILAAIKSIPAFDDADIIKAIQAIPAFDDTNIVDAINSIPTFDASGIITTIRNTSDTAVTKLTSLLTTSDKILGAVNSGNSTLSSINSKLSTISGQLTKIVNALNSGSSSGGTTVSVSASAISDPIVSAVDVLRVSLIRQLSDTWYTSTAMDEYTVPAYGTCYIPFAVGDYPDDDSWGFYSSGLYVIPGDVEISPDIIDSNFIPSDYGFGEEGSGWFTGSAFSTRQIYTNDYFSGVTVVNASGSDILLYVCSPDGDFTASLYTLGRTISGKLTLILNRIPTSGGSASAVDLTGVITGINNVNANVTALNTSLNTNLDSLVDKLQIVVDNSTTNVENVTNVVIEETNNAYIRVVSCCLEGGSSDE